ncbi:MAG: hypothetical protein ACFFB3_12300, partial [Candidatus Hodarchaeota archaeon]
FHRLSEPMLYTIHARIFEACRGVNGLVGKKGNNFSQSQGVPPEWYEKAGRISRLRCDRKDQSFLHQSNYYQGSLKFAF